MVWSLKLKQEAHQFSPTTADPNRPQDHGLYASRTLKSL
jgi:hypothetical protein